jgi:hypothetical protein
MTRLLALLSALAWVAATWAGNELPKSDDVESFDIEPPLLIPDQSLDKPPIPVAPETLPAPVADADRLEKDLERAKRNAKSAERLVKIGALAKVEAEQRALRVIRLQADLENARVLRAREELTAQQAKRAANEISQADLSETESALARAVEAAQAANAARERAELEAAELNLNRQRKLLALGSGRKSEVSRAEQKLAELRAPKN